MKICTKIKIINSFKLIMKIAFILRFTKKTKIFKKILNYNNNNKISIRLINKHQINIKLI